MPDELPEDLKKEVKLPALSHQSAFEAMLAENRAHDTEEEADPKKKEEKKEEETVTDEDVSKISDLMADQLGFRRDKKETKETKEETKAEVKTEVKKTEKKEETTKEEEKVEAEAETETADDKAKAKNVRVRKKDPAPDTSDIANVAATTAAKTVEKALESLKPKAEKKADPLAEIEATLSEDEKEELTVFRKMAEENPAQKELPKQYLKSITRINDYIARWQQSNPGKQFDAEDEEHNEFYAQVTPKFSDREFRKAEASLAAEQILQKQDSRRQREQEEIRVEMALRDVEPVIRQTKAMAARDIVASFGKEFDKIIEEKGWDEFVNADPEAAAILSAAARRVAPFIVAARQIDEPKARIPIDEKNAHHIEYLNYILAQEEEMAAAPAAEKLREGRRWVSRRDYAALPPAQRARHWYLDDNDLIQRRVAEEAKSAREEYDAELARIQKAAERFGYKKVDAGKTPQTTTATDSKKTETAAKTKAEVKSVESTGSNSVDTSGTKVTETDKDWLDSTFNVLFQR